MPLERQIHIDLVALRAQYPNRWVAVDPDTREIICNGARVVDVLEWARETNVRDPLILFMGDYRCHLLPFRDGPDCVYHKSESLDAP